MESKRALFIIITLAIFSLVVAAINNDILNGAVALLLGIPAIIVLFNKYLIKKEIKKEELFFDICASIMAVTLVVETILKIVNYLAI